MTPNSRTDSGEGIDVAGELRRLAREHRRVSAQAADAAPRIASALAEIGEHLISAADRHQESADAG